MDIGDIETYSGDRLAVVRKRGDSVNGWDLSIGNMLNGWPLEVGGRTFKNLETAYIAGVFSGSGDAEHIRAQEAVRAQGNGFMAKRRFRDGRGGHEWVLPLQRPDFNDPWHLDWMGWLWWRKVSQHPDFATKVLAIPDDWAILEDGRGRDARWGCIKQKDGSWTGRNYFGVIAMEVRRALRAGTVPDIDLAVLDAAGMWWFGAPMRFAGTLAPVAPPAAA